MKNIIFIGGIHGSGKGKICEVVKNKTDLIHLTASEVLRWNELSNYGEKLVKNIPYTQNRLIINLKKIIEKDKKYLLDGHYCLLNDDSIPQKIPINTFKDINPLKLILVITEAQIIKERLENRDSKNYDIRLIENFQNLESSFANEISKILKVPLFIINDQNFETKPLLDFLI